jgi:hypothetical protein
MAAWQEMPDIAHGAVGRAHRRHTHWPRWLWSACWVRLSRGSLLAEQWNQLRVMVPASAGPSMPAPTWHNSLVALALIRRSVVQPTLPASDT